MLNRGLGIFAVTISLSGAACAHRAVVRQQVLGCVASRKSIFQPDHELTIESVRAVDGTNHVALRSLRTDDTLARCGARNGDVLFAINGAPIDSVEAAIGEYGRLKVARQWRLSLLRQDRPIEVLITFR